jgi:hypothetical protein
MTYTARIEVQNPFCQGCLVGIKNKLQCIDEVNNISLYPKNSLVIFNYMKATKLSEVLNVLSEIGYPEKGERESELQFPEDICSC